MNIDRITQDYINSAFDGSLIKYLSHLINVNALMSSLTDIETSLIWDFIESQQKTIERVCHYESNGDFYHPECNMERGFYDHPSTDDYRFCPLCGGKIVLLD
jgi:hypothetical protein